MDAKLYYTQFFVAYPLKRYLVRQREEIRYQNIP